MKNNINLHKHQEFHEPRTFFRLARGAGKTTALAQQILEWTIMDKSDVWVMGDSPDAYHRGLYATLRRLGAIPIRKTPSDLKFNAGGKIRYFLSYSLRSLGRDSIVVIDNAELVEEKAVLCVAEHYPRWAIAGNMDAPNVPCFVQTATMLDNPYLNPEYIRKLKEQEL